MDPHEGAIESEEDPEEQIIQRSGRERKPPERFTFQETVKTKINKNPFLTDKQKTEILLNLSSHFEDSSHPFCRVMLLAVVDLVARPKCI